MKNLILGVLMTVSPFSYSQDVIEYISTTATEEHPGIPTSPIVYTVTHYFMVNENNVRVEALLSYIPDSLAQVVVFKKGDKFAIQFKTYSHNDPQADEDSFSNYPYIYELSEAVKAIIFPSYNYDGILQKSYYPVYVFDGVKYEFDLPLVKEEDIQRIYYPSVKLTPSR
jgi:hypothetical protein